MANGGYSVEQYVSSGQYGNEQEQDYGEYDEAKPKLGNTLPVWGNPRTMNINNLILTNIQASPYFKVKLYGLKTYHEVIDEIYYKIDNLEPWERGSRKTAGQTGMCGGVRGVGTGGIVSTSYCILFKLSTLKLTRKQLNGMLNHSDSPYIRGLGLMYIRYCQPPKDLYAWLEPYLDDEEEIDPKAGGGAMMTIGSMARTLLTKLEWFDTLFPRIPVPIQKQNEEKLKARMMARKWARSKNQEAEEKETVSQSDERMPSRSRSQHTERSRHRSGSRSRDSKHRDTSRRRSRSHDSKHRDSSRRRSRERDQDRSRHDDHKESIRSRSRQERDRKERSHSKSPGHGHKQRTKDRKQRSHSKSPGRSHKQHTKDKKRRSHSKSPERSHKKRTKSKEHKRKRSRSRDRDQRKKERSHRD